MSDTMRTLLFPLMWLRAFVCGYFVSNCPMCGKTFFGFERGMDLQDKYEFGKGKMTCSRPSCMERTKEESNKRIAQLRQTGRYRAYLGDPL